VTFTERKTYISLDRTTHEFGPPSEKPLLVAGICGVVSNPFAGRHVAELEPAMKELEPLGLRLARELLDAMGCSADDIESYGKGAIVGAAGELEHGALWHAPGGYGMRQLLGDTRAIVPTIQLQVPDAPRPDELVFCLAMATGPRIHARMGGLQADDIIGEDGLR